MLPSPRSGSRRSQPFDAATRDPVFRDAVQPRHLRRGDGVNGHSVGTLSGRRRLPSRCVVCSTALPRTGHRGTTSLASSPRSCRLGRRPRTTLGIAASLRRLALPGRFSGSVNWVRLDQKSLAGRSSPRGNESVKSQRYDLQHTSSTVPEATVVGQMLMMTEITIGGKRCRGAVPARRQNPTKAAARPWDRRLVGDGSAR